jgi:hypothetical protein
MDMTKRLQVLMDDSELREIQRLARKQRLTTADWVRRELRAAAAEQQRPDAGTKLRAIDEASAHDFPAPAIDQLLAEIERGYAAELP